jgi:hypothetical protein
VCDKCDVQVAGVAGFYAPGSTPVTSARAGIDFRRAQNVNTSVVLESRDAPRRPAAVYGAVLVEAPPIPKTAAPDQPSALLQVWPEPRLQWQSTAGVKVTRAADANGTRLAAEYVAPGAAQSAGVGGAVVVRNPDGTAKLIRDPGGQFQLPGAFRPNARQALVRFKPGEKPPAATAELEASLFGTVRCGIEPLSKAEKLQANTPAAGTGAGGVEMSVTYRAGANGRFLAAVELGYDPNAVSPAGAGDDLPGVRGGAAGLGNHCVFGVRITDADGKPFALGLTGGENRVEPGGKRATMRLSLELHPDKDGQGPPAAVTFWGSYARPVEVPVRLKDVALSGGK